MTAFFTYIDWTLESTPRPFYVGKGTSHRVQLIQRNRKHTNVAAKYGHRREVVLMTSVEQIAIEHEVSLICELKTYHELCDIGCNFTLGGEGISGYKHSDDAKRRMSRLGSKHTPETREKMSQVKRGKKPTAACEANTGRRRKPFSEEHRLHLKEARRRRTEREMRQQ